MAKKLMLGFVMMNVNRLSVIMLSVIIPNADMPSLVASVANVIKLFTAVSYAFS
jgi:hypothetical protein